MLPQLTSPSGQELGPVTAYQLEEKEMLGKLSLDLQANVMLSRWSGTGTVYLQSIVSGLTPSDGSRPTFGARQVTNSSDCGDIAEGDGLELMAG